MRITGGIYRGRTIKCPPGIIRPAMDRMRESLFSILGPMVGKSFLDLFSGSAVVALEAASRGAEPVDLVEMDFGKKKVLMENIKFADPPPNVHFSKAERFIQKAKRTWDLIYLDPPFPMKNKISLLEEISKKDILAPEGLMILHYPGEEKYPEALGRYKKKDLRTYGRSHLVFYLNTT